MKIINAVIHCHPREGGGKAGIQQKNKFRIADKILVLSRYAGHQQSLDSGLRRNDEVLA